MPTPPTLRLEPIDRWIRAGDLGRACRAVKELEPELRSEDRLAFARLCRRAGIPLHGLRALRPIVRPGARRFSMSKSCGPEVLAEYAALLLRLGATAEASIWLSRVDERVVPEKNLFEAFAHFRRWDYAAALGPLERYCADPRLEPYARLVGQLNLAAARVDVGQAEAAEALLREILDVARTEEHRLIRGNALETWVQLKVFGGERAPAVELLEEVRAQGFLRPGPESLLFRKWEAIVGRSSRPDDARSREVLVAVASEARALGSWEVVRDCDFHEARVLGPRAGRKLMERLFFGTPFPAYRQRVLALGLELSRDSYDWRFGSGRGPARARDRIDVCVGTIRGEECQALRPDSLGFRLLRVLSSDFYRPWRMAELHAELYPGFPLDWESSSLRIHQLIHRVRAALRSAGSGVRIVEAKETYRLESPNGSEIRVGRLVGLLDHIESEFGRASFFSALEAEARLGIGSRTLRRKLSASVASGEVERRGTTRGTVYRLV